MKKVTGIGGVFFKCDDPKKMKEWYAKNLGIESGEYGAAFNWVQDDKVDPTGCTAWNIVDRNTKYFEPSKKDFMINYRVENLVALVEQLKTDGVTIIDEIASYDYGKFVHILDPEGNTIELWEPA
ncbi:VOC family protein [Cytophaga hutchinsonii]|nr:VOC family protein [Cytophaga hutchinsonii]